MDVIKKYNPQSIGYVWDDNNPRIQLEPIGIIRAVLKIILLEAEQSHYILMVTELLSINHKVLLKRLNLQQTTLCYL